MARSVRCRRICSDSGLEAACDREGIVDFGAGWLTGLADEIESGGGRK